ncbi:uncharacterized protein STEHIDRAFT_82087 [Stereum hirsutum FP-91666 SS1]|uniref:uncharacterized protein n=1 Tax=Stereum hirsutum (strain FP-91666) TaxID=721885 RepID=UPI000444A388|nr:uncharacterized protein STEHIDRAFT_82087 [Stereum hirsutum FP-91666 SS1]EIM84206.1 hypothetical protein STEHIDRAFT_82087 [Stereum hirsutum FP-91666 SS1]
MSYCSDCGDRWFKDNEAWFQHCRDRYDHHLCEQCERLFATDNGLDQHLRTAAVHQDNSDSGYRGNYNNAGYEYDDDDEEEEFESDSDEDPFCDSCNRVFVDREGLFQHLAASSSHNWCFVCSRDFATAQGLEQHSQSRVHKPSDLKCPLCSSRFTVPSAIAQHIESGACHNGSRHQVTAAVRSLNIASPISVSHRLTQGPPTSVIVSYQATELAFNPRINAYECYLCHGTFRTIHALNRHLNSAAHDQDEFKCPKCRRLFTLVSGLIQHIESEVCGLARFQQVEDEAHELMTRFTRALTM